jgi:hypothetical protein
MDEPVTAVATAVIALATIWQIRVYITQNGILKRTLEQYEKATKTAHDTFVSTHRPKIAVRNITTETRVGSGMKIAGQFRLFNTGETTATVTKTCTKSSSQPIFRGRQPATKKFQRSLISSSCR